MGIDPGITGGLAMITPEWTGAIALPRLGAKDIDLLVMDEWWANSLDVMGNPALVVIEKAQAMPKQGVVSAFNYGKVYGLLLGFLQMKGWPFIEVTPSKWKAAMNLIGKEKEDSIKMATQLFPNVELKRKRDHNRAEALLLAEYGRRLHV